MSILNKLRELARRLGVECHHYNPSQSQHARVARLLEIHRIDLVLDVGANDGGYGRYLREIGYRGRIVSFEPLSSAYGKLIQSSQGDSDWQIAPRMALGAKDGEIDINVAGNSVSSSILPMQPLHSTSAPQSSYVGVEHVPLRRLESVAQTLPLDSSHTYLKIDTQGYEMPVLEGAEPLLPQIAGIQLELSLAELYEGQPLYADMIEWLTQRGYEAWNFLPGFSDPASGRLLQMDGVFFRADHT